MDITMAWVNSPYFSNQENRCTKLLNDLNNHLHWFKEINRQPLEAPIDYLCIDKKGRKTHIETKERKGTIKQFLNYNDILIEPGKMEAFARIAESGHQYDEQRLYVNFTKDGVIIFNLNKEMTLNWYPNHKHKNIGRKTDEFEDRLGIPMRYAIFYRKAQDGTYQLHQWCSRNEEERFIS